MMVGVEGNLDPHSSVQETYSMSLTSDIIVAFITQVGTLAAALVVGVFAIITNVRVKRVEAHASQAATDVAVVRSETRNAHNPDQPMRHDIDRILANQERADRSQQTFESKIMARLDGHDQEFRGLREDGTHQWDAIRAATHTATQASQDSASALKAVGKVITSTIQLPKR